MQITHADNHTWKKTISPDIFSDFGKSNTKKLKQFISSEEFPLVSYEFSVLDEGFFEWFQPLYDSLIATRKNFGGYNVKENTLQNTKTKYTHYSLTLKVDGTPIGGAIFTLRKDNLSIAYRTFPARWPESISSRCTPALYGEYLLTEHALEKNLPILTHGADRNPYGLNSAIGIAIFKLSVGCHAELQKTHEVLSLDPQNLDTDVLVLHYPEDGKVISDATLFCDPENLQKYEQLFKYPDLLTIAHQPR